MRDEGLLSIDYNTKSHAFALTYEPDSEIDIAEIAAYADDASLGKCNDIMVFEGQYLSIHVTKHEGKWTDVPKTKNGV